MSQKVLVAGTGKSGIAAAKLLLAMGGEVVLYDGNDKLDPEKIKENFEEDAKVTVVLGELTRPDLLGVELSIISPGIPLDAPFVPVLDEAKIPIWSEIQLAYHVAKGQADRHYRNQRKDDYNCIDRCYHEDIFQRGVCGRKHWHSVYRCGPGHDRKVCDRGRSFQLPA